MAKERLQKIVARAGLASRRGAEDLIRSGRVRVNGRVVTELGTVSDTDEDKIEVDGRPIVAEKPVYLILHKPRKVVSTRHDPEGRPTVTELVSSVDAHLYPVGRLDFHTSGALLLTNDGEFTQGMLHPRREVPKVYVAKVQGEMTTSDLDIWRNGVQLDDGVTAPCEAKLLRHEGDKTWIEVTLHEGRNQQIRRMGEATGFPIMRLARLAFAGITTEGLRPGSFRPLSTDELRDLKAAYGVPRRVRQAPLSMTSAKPTRLGTNDDRPRSQSPERSGRSGDERPGRGGDERPVRGAGERPGRGTGERPDRRTSARPERGASERPDRRTAPRTERGGERPERGGGERPDRRTSPRPERGGPERPGRRGVGRSSAGGRDTGPEPRGARGDERGSRPSGGRPTDRRGPPRGREEQAPDRRGPPRGRDEQTPDRRGPPRGREEQAPDRRGPPRGREEQPTDRRGAPRGREEQAPVRRGPSRGREEPATDRRGPPRGREEPATGERGGRTSRGPREERGGRGAGGQKSSAAVPSASDQVERGTRKRPPSRTRRPR